MLLVDLDPQACLTFSLGIDPEDLELSMHHVLTKGLHASEVIIETDDGVDLLPATIELARAEADLLTRTGREHVLKGALDDLAEDPDGRRYDWVLLDCPPSLGVMTVAALTAAQGVLIPLQCETLSHRGVGQLLDTVHDVRRFTNRDLEVWGVLPTLYDGRTNHARTVLETISDTYDLDVIEPPIPKTIKFAEAPAAGRSILATSRSSKGARAYREVAANLRAAQPDEGRELSTHRREVRPRYGRMAVLATSLTISAVAALAGLGVLATGSAYGRCGGRARVVHQQHARRAESAEPQQRPVEQRLGAGHRRPPTRRRRPRSPSTAARAGGSSSARASSGSGCWGSDPTTYNAPTWSRAA